LRILGYYSSVALIYVSLDCIIVEHVEPWTYVKFPYPRGVGWNGFTDCEKSGIFSVAPLARLNVADGMATPKAQEAYEESWKP